MTAKGEVAPAAREALAWIGLISQVGAHSCYFIFVQILIPAYKFCTTSVYDPPVPN